MRQNVNRYYRSRMDADDYVAIAFLALAITTIAAFIRHVWWIITICMSSQPLYGGQVVLAVLGVIFPPLGALHGVWLWLN